MLIWSAKGWGMHFFTADLHLGDAAVFKYEQRPFASVEEMNEALIASCRDCMTKKDDLWIIGDFVRGANVELARQFLNAVPGRKHLVAGNHDRETILGLPEWESVNRFVETKCDGQPVTMLHYPMMTWNGAHHGGEPAGQSIHIFGHIHKQTKGWWRAVNAGVDVWDYRPASLEDILKRSEENYIVTPMQSAFFPERIARP